MRNEYRLRISSCVINRRRGCEDGRYIWFFWKKKKVFYYVILLISRWISAAWEVSLHQHQSRAERVCGYHTYYYFLNSFFLLLNICNYIYLSIFLKKYGCRGENSTYLRWVVCCEETSDLHLKTTELFWNLIKCAIVTSISTCLIYTISRSFWLRKCWEVARVRLGVRY